MPQYTLGADVDDLKATCEKMVQAFNSFDAHTIAGLDYPGHVGFYVDGSFPEITPIENTVAETAASIQEFFDTLDSLSITLVNPQYRVVENTGIMWGYETASIKYKDGPVRTFHSRITQTFVKKDGKWLLLTIHMSYIPTGSTQ